jgi:acetyl esterase/lipase
MRRFAVRILYTVLSLVAVAAAQDVIPLYPGIAPGSTQQNYPEKAYVSPVWHEDVITNVTRPTLTVFQPSPELKNGTAVVICPGGGFMALVIGNEGTDLAKYLAAKGVTAFVLKYRVAHTDGDATQEFDALYADKQKFVRP